MDKSGRNTFVSYGEVLETAADQCKLAACYLRECRSDASEPWDAMVEAIVEEEQELANSLKRYAEKGPEEIVGTRLQYTLEVDPKPAPDSLGQALKRLDATNDEIERLLAQQREKAGAFEMREEFDQLKEKVETVARKISMIRVSAEDV